MTCPDPEILSAFADGELEASMIAEIERHLCDCATCREFVDELRWLDALGRSSLRAIEATVRHDPVDILRSLQDGRQFLPPYSSPLRRGERESNAAPREAEHARLVDARATGFPLPEEEGQREGEGDVRLPSGVVCPGDDFVLATPSKTRFSRQRALAAAAVVLMTLTVAAWFLAQRLSERRVVSGAIDAVMNVADTHRLSPSGTPEPARSDRFSASSDEAFERWAKPFRQLRIPLVPMEEVANYRPPEILPVPADSAKPKSKS